MNALPKPCDNCRRLINAQVSIDPCPGNTCRRCPWRACRCAHVDPCDRGFIETAHVVAGYDTAVRRCPVCALASFETGPARWAS